MSSTSYVQLPPDGVGKKVRHRLITDVKVTGVIAVPTVGTILTGDVSGASGTFTGQYSAEDVTWYFRDTVGTFNVNPITGVAVVDRFKDAQNNYYSTASSVVSTIYSSALNIVDANIPAQGLSVDKRGSALTTFPEGTPQFDALGRQQLSQMLAVGEYYHFVQDLPGKYATSITNNSTYATVFHKPTSSSVNYIVGSVAGDYVGRTTGQYHPYKPGVSQLMYTSVAIGDTGVNNVVREWGYFDQFNGFGFRLDGTTVKVFLRSDVTGIISDPTTQVRSSGAAGNAIDYEVTQANWNINRLDNAQTSDFLLDVSKSNLYWMDVQGLDGRVRLGVETPDGRRITCHEFRPLNSIEAAFTQNGSGLPCCRNLSLPITWASRTKGSTGGAASAQYVMRVGFAVLFTESADVQYTGVLTHIFPDDPVTINSATNYVPFLSFKAKNMVAGPAQVIDDNPKNMPNPMIIGNTYVIEALGTVNWSQLGWNFPNPKVGASFIYNGVTVTGSNGRVHMNIPNSIIGIHETFDWANQGGNNMHVGIFVLPNEKWMVNTQWSETIQPQTMLYVDQNCTSFAQYQYWGETTTALMGSISGNVMTIGTGSNLQKEMYVERPPLYASGPLAINGVEQYASVTGTVTPRTKIVKQITAFGGTASPSFVAQANTLTGSTQAIAGSNRVMIQSLSGVGTTVSGIGIGHLVTGTNISSGTFVENIIYVTTASTTATITLSNPLIGIPGPLTFYQPGGTGTYLISTGGNINGSQSVAFFSGYQGYYVFHAIESFMAPANSAGRAALGDRIEKSFGLGPGYNAEEDAKGCFVFAAKLCTSATNIVPVTPQSLMYTKYWKEIR
jgi:hypothetical protein